MKKNLFGMIGLVFGVAALIFMLSVKTAPKLNDYRTGVVSNLLQNITYAFLEKEPVPTEPQMRAIKTFPLTKREEQIVLISMAVLFCVLSLVFSFFAKIKSEFSFFPALAVLSAFLALSVWSFLAALLYGIIALIAAINYRERTNTF